MKTKNLVRARLFLASFGVAVIGVKSAVDGHMWTTAPVALVPALIFGHAAISAADNAWATIKMKANEKDQKRASDFMLAAIGLAFSVADQPRSCVNCQAKEIDARDVGVSLFAVKKTRVRRRETLERVERFRFPGGPERSNVAWTKGKGAIGEAWRDGRTVHSSLLPLALKLAGGLDDTKWNSLTDADKGQFKREELQEVGQKYSEVLALPIKDAKAQVIGCLSVDLSHNPQAVHNHAHLGSHKIDVLTRGALSLVRQYVEKD